MGTFVIWVCRRGKRRVYKWAGTLNSFEQRYLLLAFFRSSERFLQVRGIPSVRPSSSPVLFSSRTHPPETTNLRPTTMDHSQQQQQQLHDDHSQNYVPQSYPMYPPEDDYSSSLVYQPQMPNYPVVPSGTQPRGSRLLSYISPTSHSI